MTREFCVLDMSLPAIDCGDGDAWFFSRGKWHWTSSGDLIHNGRLIDKGEFDARFGELPPLPVKNR